MAPQALSRYIREGDVIFWLRIMSFMSPVDPSRSLPIGNHEAQERFRNDYSGFLAEYPQLRVLIKEAIIRALPTPSNEDVLRVRDLPDDDPRVVEFENSVLADRVVFGLGRTAAQAFDEVIVLAGNGLGIGALKILRGLYETVVTAGYIAKSPYRGPSVRVR